MHRLIPVLAGLLLIAAAIPLRSAAPAEVLVVLSREHESHTQVVDAMRSVLAERGAVVRVTVMTGEQYRNEPAALKRAALAVTVGTLAARELSAERNATPLLHTLVPRQAILELDKGGRESAIYLDQPVARQLELLRLALPKANRLGVVLGPASQGLRGEITAAARRHAFKAEILTIMTQADLLPTLARVLEDNDVLLSVPDPMVYSSDTVHHVLLTTYRYEVPVLGLSRGYVDAGALLAVYSTPDQIGRQAGELIAGLAAAGRWQLPPAQFPRYYSVAVNERVAASLGLRMESEEALLRKLTRETQESN
jgi:ABC-type uncharacterized transport system substrate-binding protein